MELRKKLLSGNLIRKIFFNNRLCYKAFRMKGSYTVEAVFVVPIILGLIFAMIYVIFYLHDKAVVYCNMQQAVVNVAEGRKEYKNNEEWQQDMQEGLWIFQVVSGAVNKDKMYIKSETAVECSLNIPVIGYFIGSRQEIKAEDKYLAIHPEFIIRAKDIIKS